MAVPQGSMQEGQVGVPGASLCPPAPPVSSTRTSRNDSVDLGCRNCNFIFFPHACDPPGSHRSSQQKAKESCSAMPAAMGHSLAPTLPFPIPGETPMSPGESCTVSLAYSSLHSRALLLSCAVKHHTLPVYSCCSSFPSSFLRLRGKAGHRGCSGSASNHCGDAECARSASLPGTATLRSSSIL